MQAFNLTRLNFHSPYKVWVDNGSYKFLTDYGVQYLCSNRIRHASH